MPYYNGFNYEEFYEFVIDFFEGDQTPEGKAAASELFDWWNRYVLDSRPIFAITEASQTCISTVCCHPHEVIYISKAVVARGPTTAAPSALIPLMILFSIRLK